MSDISEEIMAKARAVVAGAVEAVEPRPPGYIDDIRHGKHDELLHPEIITTARALLAERDAAEKRGYERGRAEGLEEAAMALTKRAVAVGQATCCGFGLGSPPECCGDPDYLISANDAAAAIRALKEKA